eukprot:CAMPEP_0196208978 /NCGR_PEP_ID=MMETSP0912-20130531/9380_1 /TAXON_ID=49265 /ORGANISM="Thalassiosira rotula, Strain GSO102" /LENGTH=95 /DNA_ID=CAMNT_0041483849 /DNA_START=73 /DNA_END=356 /DNA_ORIENTATION=-
MHHSRVSPSISFQLSAIILANSREEVTPCDFRWGRLCARSGMYQPRGTVRWANRFGRGGMVKSSYSPVGVGFFAVFALFAVLAFSGLGLVSSSSS